MIIINVLVVLGISLLFSVAINAAGVFLIALGAISGLMGVVNLFIGLILSIAGKTSWNQVVPDQWRGIVFAWNRNMWLDVLFHCVN